MYNAPRLSGVESGTLLRAEDQADACHRAACVAYGQYLSSVCMRFHNSHLPCFGPSFIGQLPKAQLGEEAVLTFSGLVQPCLKVQGQENDQPQPGRAACDGKR